MNNSEVLQNLLKEEVEKLEGDALVFYEDYDLENLSYFDDMATEFADNRTSIYYADQKEYYLDHREECEKAFDELYGYNGDWIANYIKNNGIEGLMCFVGMLGEFEAIRRQVSDYQSEILKAMSYRRLIDLENINALSIKKLNEAIEYINAINYEDGDEIIATLNDLIDEEN